MLHAPGGGFVGAHGRRAKETRGKRKQVGRGAEGWDAGADACRLEGEAAVDCRKNGSEEEGKEEHRAEKRIQCGAAQ